MKHKELEKDGIIGVDIDCEEASTLLSQETRANGIILEGLPRGLQNDLRIASADGTLVEHPEGGSLQNKIRKSPNKCKEHAETHKWRDACGKKKGSTHTSYTKKLEHEREEGCRDHHRHPHH